RRRRSNRLRRRCVKRRSAPNALRPRRIVWSSCSASMCRDRGRRGWSGCFDDRTRRPYPARACNRDHWKVDPERRPRWRRVVLPGQGPAVQLGEMANDGQSEPQSAWRPRRPARALTETLEDVREKVGLDADAAVADDELDVIAGLPATHIDPTSGG